MRMLYFPFSASPIGRSSDHDPRTDPCYQPHTIISHPPFPLNTINQLDGCCNYTATDMESLLLQASAAVPLVMGHAMTWNQEG